MKRALKESLIFVATMSVALALAGTLTVALAAGAPNINNAYHHLRRAHYVLEHSCRRLGGHRVAAMNEIKAAIGELQLAAQTVHARLPAVGESGSPRSTGQRHPYIHDAIQQCNSAKAELASAKSDFGGHKVNAINHVNAALTALHAALSEPACK